MRSSVFFKRFLILVIAIVIIGTVIYWWRIYQIEIPLAEHTFKVEQIDNPYKISIRLKEQGIIRSPLLFYVSYVLLGKGSAVQSGAYKLSTGMTVKEMIYTLEEKPWAKYVELPPNATKEELGKIIGDALGWKKHDSDYFGHTYAGMQWQNYEHHLEELFTEKYKWKKSKAEAFLTLSAIYYDNQYDFFKKMYIPGTYEFPIDSSRAEVAGILIERFDKEYTDKHTTLARFLDQETMDNVAKLIEEEMILMPDIVSIPPQDLVIKNEGNRKFLLFTTSYWNKGRGPLELIADPKTKGIAGDYDRDVYQRIYHLDGDYTERLSGRFLWHEAHLHYHFQDFAVYEFIPVDVVNSDYNTIKSFKSTFCVRDSEPIDLSHPGAIKDASYKICGKERQGISPGWADSYYYTYIDQRFEITDIPSGTYRLKMIINPKDRFDEITLENNVGEALIQIDTINDTIKVLEEKQYGL